MHRAVVLRQNWTHKEQCAMYNLEHETYHAGWLRNTATETFEKCIHTFWKQNLQFIHLLYTELQVQHHEYTQVRVDVKHHPLLTSELDGDE
jgi:hypothetical protein